jgi:AcrR family transcriptional regulator
MRRPKTKNRQRPAARDVKKPRWGSAVLDRNQQRHLRREALFRTAAQAFNESSFHTTTLADLAARLNVTKPTLYYYVKDKDDILFECQRMALEQMKDVLDEHRNSALTGIKKLEKFLRRYAELMTDDFGICLVRTGLLPLKSSSREKLLQFARQIDHRLREIIQAGTQDGSIREIEPHLAANAIFGGMNGIANWFKPEGALTKEVMFNEYIGLFRRALLK